MFNFDIRKRIHGRFHQKNYKYLKLIATQKMLSPAQG